MATIFDVAAAAGVSHQTVSRALKGDPTVREEIRVRVDEAVQRLQYRPNAAARALASRRTRTLGLLATGLSDFGPSSITAAFNAAARRAGWDVAIEAVDHPDASMVRASAEALLNRNVEALVVVSPTDRVAEALGRAVRAVPLITTVPEGVPGAAVVAIDHEEGAALAVRHLAELGHRRVVHVAGPADWPEAVLRLAGWRREAERLGLEAGEPLRGDWTAATGHRIGAALAAGEPPTAVFAANDQTALGMLAAFREAGLRVPQDVSVVGFDDVPEAPYLAPPLTTVRQDFPVLGQKLMGRVDALLSGADPEPESIVPELVLRASTAPPRD